MLHTYYIGSNSMFHIFKNYILDVYMTSQALKTIYNQNGKDASLEKLIKESLNIL